MTLLNALHTRPGPTARLGSATRVCALGAERVPDANRVRGKF